MAINVNVQYNGGFLPDIILWCVFLFCSHWSLVDVPLIFFCPADHVPDWQPRVLLGMVEARSVNVKKTTTTQCYLHRGTCLNVMKSVVLYLQPFDPT